MSGLSPHIGYDAGSLINKMMLFVVYFFNNFTHTFYVKIEFAINIFLIFHLHKKHHSCFMVNDLRKTEIEEEMYGEKW